MFLLSLPLVLSLLSPSLQSDHHQNHHHQAAHLAEALAGSGQMLGETLAAGLTRNSQWFSPLPPLPSPEGSDPASACEDQASTASLQQGWPSTGDLLDMSGAICWRRRRLFHGGSWGPWRYVRGSLRQTFVPNFLSADAPVVPGEIISDTE